MLEDSIKDEMTLQKTLSLHKLKTRMAQNNNSSEVGKRSGGSCRDVGTFHSHYKFSL